MRELLTNLGIAAPESDENLFDTSVISSLKRVVNRVLSASDEQSQPKWISIEEEPPVDGEKYWHTHIKDDGTFTPVYRGVYIFAFSLMKTDSNGTMAFTHFMQSKPPQPPEVSDDE
jgi:hypothetical protein